MLRACRGPGKDEFAELADGQRPPYGVRRSAACAELMSRRSARPSSRAAGRWNSLGALASSAHAQARRGAGPGLEHVEAGVGLLVGVADAASTMPSLRPNFILRGARLATITVSLPTRSSGCVGAADAAEDVARRPAVPSPTSSVRRSSLVAPSTRSASTILAMRRSTLAKSSMPISAASASPPGSGAARRRPAASNSASSSFGVDALHQVLVVADAVAAERARRVGEVQRRHLQEGLDLRGQRRQHRLEVDGQHAEGLDAHAAHVVQHGVRARPAWPAPRACAGRRTR